MPTPQAICIEDLNATDPNARYLRCVALGGRQPGLRLDRGGQALWRSDEDLACELWVSADERLILYRPEDGAPVSVHRGGRALAVPAEKPVVLLDQDRLEVGDRSLRVHVHGEAPGVHAPSFLETEAPSAAASTARAATAAAAALALGLSVGAAGCKSTPEEIEVRTEPPSVAPPVEPDIQVKPDLKVNRPDMIVGKSRTKPPIEVRVAPPEPPAMPPPPPPPPPDKEKKKGKDDKKGKGGKKK